jgi:hypothetical protein
MQRQASPTTTWKNNPMEGIRIQEIQPATPVSTPFTLQQLSGTFPLNTPCTPFFQNQTNATIIPGFSTPLIQHQLDTALTINGYNWKMPFFQTAPSPFPQQ